MTVIVPLHYPYTIQLAKFIFLFLKESGICTQANPRPYEKARFTMPLHSTYYPIKN